MSESNLHKRLVQSLVTSLGNRLGECHMFLDGDHQSSIGCPPQLGEIRPDLYARALRTNEYAWRTGLIAKIRTSPETVPISERRSNLLGSSQVAGLKFAPRNASSLVTLSGSIEGEWCTIMLLPEEK